MEIIATEKHFIGLSDRQKKLDVHIYNAKGTQGDAQESLRNVILSLLGNIETNENNQIEVSLFAAALKDTANKLMDDCLALQFQSI